MLANEYMRIMRCQQEHPIEPIRLIPIDAKPKRTKRLILTPTYIATTIATVVISALFAGYLVVMGFLIYYAPTAFQKGLVLNVFVIGLVVLYLLARMPFYLRLGVIFFGLLTLFILRQTTELPLWIAILSVTIIVLSLGYGQYHLQRTKEKIWHKYIQQTESFPGSTHKGLIGLMSYVTPATISKKYYAEENTNTLIRKLQQEQSVYKFSNREIPRTDDYIDNILLAGKNIVLTRSITLPETEPTEKQSHNPNAYHPVYAEDTINEFSLEFPNRNIHLYYVVYSEDEEYTIPYTPITENVHFIKPQEFSQISNQLMSGSKLLLTSRDDILRLATISYTRKPDITKDDYEKFTRRF